MNESLFSRVPLYWRPTIEAARALIPIDVALLIEPRFLVCESPRFVGLHYQDMAANFPHIAASGYTYEHCAHACFTGATPDGRQTVVFPDPTLYPDPVGTVVHEIAHLWDEATGFTADAPESTNYSRSNRYERIAEAFKMIVKPASGDWREWSESDEALRPMRTLMGVA